MAPQLQTVSASVDVRDRLVDVLHRDLIGADPEEILNVAPSRWYLAGFLVPHEANIDVRQDPDPEEALASGDDAGGDDATPPEMASARKAFFPSSMGLSVLVPAATKSLSVRAQWGEYKRKDASLAPPVEADAPPASQAVPARTPERWQRTPQEATQTITIPATGRAERVLAEGVKIVVSVRCVPAGARVEAGARAVSVFLVNDREVTGERPKDESFLFQARLELETAECFLPRPNVRGQQDYNDPDERIAELQYRDVFEYAVGHGVSAHAEANADHLCTRVGTTWLPTAEVERVEPTKDDVIKVELGMERLAEAKTADEVRGLLGKLPIAYLEWIERQAKTEVAEHQRDVLVTLLDDARTVQRRIVEGLATLDNPDVLDAFRTANRAMARAARARQTPKGTKASDPPGRRPTKRPPPAEPKWRPFQLAFLLLNLRGLHEPHHDRDVIDLLFFPTGGGKTEAYLGLAAFALVLRRLRSTAVGGAGVAVIMRYTLRLLTLDQLGRATALVCALELERLERLKQGDASLGSWPFEIGLWVGERATPNRMGAAKNFNPKTARNRVLAYQKASDRNPLPVPIEKCPWCDAKFAPSSFKLTPDHEHPTNLEVWCTNRDCDFSRDRPLPMLTVDEPIYQRLPCFLIATVDKFAQLPWTGETGALFGKVDRYDSAGFYGPCSPGIGRPLPNGQLAPPELVIQDELHLISGPLGTMVGLYETAIDLLCERKQGDKTYGPKIIASTATVRRADAQIKAIFGRSTVTVFPPPGPDRRDSFFARTADTTEKHARKYVGVAAPGRSLKVGLLRVYLALLAAAQRQYEAAGDAADPYTTLVGYFNSLRELGGSRRIVEDEVASRIRGYDTRRRVSDPSGDFQRRSLGEPVEITSREPMSKVARAKDRLGCTMEHADHVDVALATNMISVGLDIQRLGLMVVLGQPKTTSEYIQATSRVGRDDQKPGLVVTLLNCHKPRDRSHYERFAAYHASFYRAVEATSVTPFSPRAIDRGIAGVTVALERLSLPELTPPRGAEEIVRSDLRERVNALPKRLARRVEQAHVDKEDASDIGSRVENRMRALLDSWRRTVEKLGEVSGGLQYQREEPNTPALLRAPLDPKPDDPDHAKFKAPRSLRDVEPSVDIYVRKPAFRTQEDV